MVAPQQIYAAPLMLRCVALFIDSLVLIVPAALLPGLMTSVWLDDGVASLVAGAFLVPLGLLPGALLLALIEGLAGRTLGKALMSIRIVDVEDGRPIGMIRAIGRRAIMLLESSVAFIPSLLLIPFMRSFDGLLGDRLTGSIVAQDVEIARAFPRPSAKSLRG